MKAYKKKRTPSDIQIFRGMALKRTENLKRRNLRAEDQYRAGDKKDVLKKGERDERLCSVTRTTSAYLEYASERQN